MVTKINRGLHQLLEEMLPEAESLMSRLNSCVSGSCDCASDQMQSNLQQLLAQEKALISVTEAITREYVSSLDGVMSLLAIDESSEHPIAKLNQMIYQYQDLLGLN